MREISSTKARIYADILLTLTTEVGTVEDVEAAILGIAGRAREEPALRIFFQSSALSTRARRRVLEAAFGPEHGVPPHLYNFLRVLADRRDLSLFLSIAREWVLLRDRRRGRLHYQLSTAQEISSDEVARISRVVAEATGKDPVAEVEVDSQLLGGIVLTIGDIRVDGSIRRRLTRLRTRLTSSHMESSVQ